MLLAGRVDELLNGNLAGLLSKLLDQRYVVIVLGSLVEVLIVEGLDI